jgi:hypothetical protein
MIDSVALRGAEVDRACNRDIVALLLNPALTVRRAGDLLTFDIYTSTQAGRRFFD